MSDQLFMRSLCPKEELEARGPEDAFSALDRHHGIRVSQVYGFYKYQRTSG